MATASTNHKVTSGQAYPLGSTVNDEGINFSIYSAHAEAVELCLFDNAGQVEQARIKLKHRTNDVWHVFVSGLRHNQLYGYRVYGPYEPKNGHRFNPNKLLIDPYAKKLFGSLEYDDAIYGYTKGHKDGHLSFDTRDSAPYVLKSVAVENLEALERKIPPVSKSDTIVYEAHPKGVTKLFPGIKSDIQGTYSALADKQFVGYLKHLGITALELLPVHYAADEPMLNDKGLVNYWGYNSIAFFAPADRYAAKDPISELREVATTLHKNGIELLLDVVYNHTAEADALGPTLSLRGIDNLSYYRLANNKAEYINDTGTGNTLNFSNPRVIQLTMDSLRYWKTTIGVDGFRFDLASVLGREDHGFDSGAGFFDAVQQDPDLATAKFFAEPWDIGFGGYQLGHFPGHWSEWNDQYRDTVRRFWQGDIETLPSVAGHMLGTSSIFDKLGNGTDKSTNLITAHDGFTLEDLVSYNAKHNEANGEDNNDGHNANHSFNYGIEGPTSDQAILDARALHKRNMLATLLLSQGVPMLLAGDEVSNSQQGNNNAYCHDSPLAWVNWPKRPSEYELSKFVSRLVAIRKRVSLLRQCDYLHGESIDTIQGFPTVSWLDKQTNPMTHAQWNNGRYGYFALLLVGKNDDTFKAALIAINKTANDVLVPMDSEHLPVGEWDLCIDTANPLVDQCSVSDAVLIASNSVVLLVCS